MSKTRFYFCPVCGNLVEKIHDSGNDMICCGEVMKEVTAGTTDGKIESHVPVCKKKSNHIKVRVGENPHPMEPHHSILWIEIVTNRGIQRKYLSPGEEPVACFSLEDGEQVCKVFAYCNIHKLFEAFC